MYNENDIKAKVLGVSEDSIIVDIKVNRPKRDYLIEGSEEWDKLVEALGEAVLEAIYDGG